MMLSLKLVELMDYQGNDYAHNNKRKVRGFIVWIDGNY